MMRQRGGSAALALLFALLVPVPAAAEFPNAPAAVTSGVQTGVEAVLQQLDDGATVGDAVAEFEGSGWNELTFAVVADAVEQTPAYAAAVAAAPALAANAARNSPITIHNVAAYNYSAATQETDKQLGALPASSGTTTLIRKPSFSSLMALAVEYGALQQQKSGTSLTLSTTPYVAAFALAPALAPTDTRGTEAGERFLDTAENYERFHVLDKLGLAANFALQEEDNETGDDYQADDFSSFSATFRFFDRSTRSSELRDAWISEVKPYLDANLRADTAALARLFNAVRPDGSVDPASRDLNARREAVGAKVTAEIATYLDRHPGESRAKKKDALTAIVLSTLRSELYDPIVSSPGTPGHIEITDAVNLGIRDSITELMHRKENLDAAQAALARIIEANSEQPLLSLGYTLHRQVESTDYSEIAVLGQVTFRSIEIIGNLSASLNHDPDAAMGQETLRDFGGGLSFEWAFRNFLTGFVDQGSSAPVTAALSGKVDYLEDTGQTLGTAQLRFDIPIGAAFSLPFSLSYASETEGSDESEFRANVGFDFDSDKLLAFALLQQATTTTGTGN